MITELGTGEALVSFLNEKGQPSVVERAYILSPQSSFDLLNESEQLALITTSPFHQKYATRIDRESAYEKLAAKASKEAQEEQKEVARAEKEAKDSFLSSLFRTIAREIAKLIMGSFKRK